MREHDYQKMMREIRVPDGLEERVLAAKGQETVPRKVRQSWGKLAVCAACVLALVLGVSLRPEAPDPMGSAETLPLSVFTLTAYAANETTGGNGSLVLGVQNKIELQTTELNPQEEQYTDYRFQIQGMNIETLTLSIDRGGIYRTKTGEGMTVLSKPAKEDYDPDAVYGLWIPPQEWMDGRGSSLLNGSELTVTAHFADGTERTNTYRLSTQKFLVSENEDGTAFLIPTLEGSDATGGFGLYVEPVNSTWFSWPVEGANTISLSNSYGFRAKPGGLGETFHAGIDIPAPEGTGIQAALDGTVTETGFDSDRGNYLVLDHGNGLTTLYAQCQTVEAEQGDTIKTGQQIATVGSTGKSTGPHLHFEVRQDGEAQNPVAYFDNTVRETLRMG